MRPVCSLNRTDFIPNEITKKSTLFLLYAVFVHYFNYKNFVSKNFQLQTLRSFMDNTARVCISQSKMFGITCNNIRFYSIDKLASKSNELNIWLTKTLFKSNKRGG